MNNDIIIYTDPNCKRYMWEGYQSIHKTLKLDELPSSYYIEISKLFNGRTKEFFMHVINRMIVSFRGYSMPTDKDYRHYIRIQKDADKEHELGQTNKQHLIEHSTTVMQRVKAYEREAQEVFKRDYPEYIGVLAYEQDPRTEKERKCASIYFGILKGVHVKYNPTGIFGTGENFKSVN
jgi:hypothetical protein